MARPRQFEVDGARERFLQTFWTKGYEATTVDDLCQASGLSKSSLYSSFGDKHDLLLQSLDRYVDIRLGHVRKIFLASKSLRAALVAMTSEIIDDIEAGPGRRGCFIGNCAAEMPRGDRRSMSAIRRGLATLEDIIANGLEQARTNGELKREANITALARFLVAGLQGLRLVGKVNPHRQTLQDIADNLIRVVS
jgi:TetR/AcrR family transcriptional repressor of nem operon